VVEPAHQCRGGALIVNMATKCHDITRITRY
jgi:hypothetical protein